MVSTSAGRYAEPLGRFSAIGTVAVTVERQARARRPRSSPRRSRPRRPCRTSSGPCPAAGLIEMPPESNVMPLPTRATLRPGAGVPDPDQPRRRAASRRRRRGCRRSRPRRAPSRRAPRPRGRRPAPASSARPAKLGRRQVVRRGVDQVAGQRDGARRRRRPARPAAARLLGLGVGHEQRDRWPGRAGSAAVAGLVARRTGTRPSSAPSARRGGQLGDGAVAAGEAERAGDPGLAGRAPGPPRRPPGDRLGVGACPSAGAGPRPTATTSGAGEEPPAWRA